MLGLSGTCRFVGCFVLALLLAHAGQNGTAKTAPAGAPTSDAKGISTKAKTSTSPVKEKDTAATPAGGKQDAPAMKAGTAGSDASIANAVLSNQDDGQGDYIPCRFTPAELEKLHTPQEARLLTASDSDELKLRVDAALLDSIQTGELVAGYGNSAMLELAKIDFTGRSLSEALAAVIDVLRRVQTTWQTAEIESQGNANTSNAIPTLTDAVYASSIYKKNKASSDAFDEYLKGLNAEVTQRKITASRDFVLSDFVHYAAKYRDLEPLVLVVTDALGKTQDNHVNRVVQSARQFLNRLERPTNVGCAMSILAPKETSKAYGYIIAREYIAVQVVVRNLDPNNEFVLHDVEYAVNTDPSGAPGRFFSGRDKVIVRSLSTAQESFDPRNITITSTQGLGSLFSAVATVVGGWTTAASGVLNSAVIPGLQKGWKDQSVDQLNLLNDTGFSSSVTSQTRVPKSGTVIVVTFVPAKQFTQGWWTQPCVSFEHVASKLGTTFIANHKFHYYASDSDEQEVREALTACGVYKDATPPATTGGVTGAKPDTNEPADKQKNVWSSYTAAIDATKGSRRSGWANLWSALALEHGKEAPDFLTLPMTDPLPIESVQAVEGKSALLSVKDFGPGGKGQTALIRFEDEKNGAKRTQVYMATLLSQGFKIDEPLEECSLHCGTVTLLDAADIFRRMKPVPYWKWTGQSLQLFANLSLVVVAGTHVVDQSDLQLSLDALDCQKDEGGNVLFPNPLPSAFTCTVKGKNLEKAAKIRLRNAKDAADSNIVEGSVTLSGGDAGSASVSFPAEKMRCLGQPDYSVFGVTNAGGEITTKLVMHLQPSPYASKVAASEVLDFKITPKPQVTLNGCNLQNVKALRIKKEQNSADFNVSTGATQDSASFVIDPKTKGMEKFQAAETNLGMALVDKTGTTDQSTTLSWENLTTAPAAPDAGTHTAARPRPPAHGAK